MGKKLEKDESLIYKDKKIHLTNRNLIIKSKPFFKERIMLGDIRRWELEGNKISISIMKKTKLREFILEVPADKNKDIFKELGKSIKECKEIEYRKTTSWYWQDLVGEEIVCPFNYEKSKFLIKTCSGVSIFLLLLILISETRDKDTFALFVGSLLMLYSAIFHKLSRLIFLKNSIIIRNRNLKYNRIYFKNLKKEEVKLTTGISKVSKLFLCRKLSMDLILLKFSYWKSITILLEVNRDEFTIAKSILKDYLKN